MSSQPPCPFLDAGVDEQGGQRLALLAEDTAQRIRAVPLQDLGRVLAVEQGRLEFAGERAEDAVGADGGLASCRVGIERDDDPGAGQVGGLAEQSGLLAGQGCAAGCQPGVPTRVGDGDGDGVERSFHDDGDSSPGEGGTGLVQAEQQVALLVGGGLGAVEVFRYVRPGTGAGSACEPGERAGRVMHGEYDPVPEPVDEGSAGGAGGEPGGLNRVVVMAEVAQVAGEGGPPGRCVPDVPVLDGGGGDAAGVQVTGCPAAVELPGVEGVGVGEDAAGSLVGLGWLARGWLGDRAAYLGRAGVVLACAGVPGLRGEGGAGGEAGDGVVVTVQDADGVAGDACGCCGDAVAGGQDSGGGLGAWVGAGPAGRVEQAADGGDAVTGAGDPGDRVGFCFAQAGAAGGGRPGRVAGAVVQQHVAELVRQRPHGLLIGDPRRDADAADGPEYGAVGRRPLFAFDRVSLAAGQPAQRVPHSCGRIAWRAGRRRR